MVSEHHLSKRLTEFSFAKEPSFKFINNCGYMSKAGVQSFIDLESVTASGIVEKYLRFGLHLHTHFVFSVKRLAGEIDARDFCAVFKRSPASFDRKVDGGPVVDGIDEFSFPEIIANHDEYAMLVDYVQLRDYPKIAVNGIAPAGIRGSALRSLVRLQSLDQCKRIGMDEVFDVPLSVPPGSAIDADREVGTVAARDKIPVFDSKLTDQVIQRGSHVVNGVSEDGRPLRITLFDFADNDINALPFIIRIHHQRIIFVFRSSPSLNSSVEIREMVLRPFELKTNPG